MSESRATADQLRMHILAADYQRGEYLLRQDCGESL